MIDSCNALVASYQRFFRQFTKYYHLFIIAHRLLIVDRNEKIFETMKHHYHGQVFDLLFPFFGS